MYEVKIFKIGGQKILSSDKLPAICPELNTAVDLAAQVMRPNIENWRIAEPCQLDVVRQDHPRYAPVRGWSSGDFTLCIMEPR